MLGGVIQTLREAARERFIRPHYHAYVRINGGTEYRIVLPKCPLDVEFVADPFLFWYGGEVYLFFEGLYADRGNRGRAKGVIGCLRENNGNWEYVGVVLEELYHLSYPQVFSFDDRIFMIPESGQASEVALYEAVEFPKKWIKKSVLISGKYVDSSIIKNDEKFYIMTAPEDPSLPAEVWISDHLDGEWKQHPQSGNILSSQMYRRNGGAICVFNGKLFRIAQDCDTGYGRLLYRIPITDVSPETYAEGSPEKLSVAIGWPQLGFHHTYNALVCLKGQVEVIDRHFNTIKGPVAFCASTIWFVLDGVRYLIKRIFMSSNHKGELK